MTNVVGDSTDSAVRSKITAALIAYAQASYMHTEECEEKPDQDSHAEWLADAIYELLGMELNTLEK